MPMLSSAQAPRRTQSGKPMRKRDYNHIVTLLSMVMAVLLGRIEVLGLVADRFERAGGFWQEIKTLNDNFNALGFIIISAFIVACVDSVLV